MKNLLKVTAFILVTGLATFQVSNSYGDELYSQDVGGIVFSWPKEIYAPQSPEDSVGAKISIGYQNNSGKDFYYIGWTLNSDPNDFTANSNQPPVFGLKLGIKSGSKGVIESSLNYAYFFNMSEPIRFSMNLCSRISLLERDNCIESYMPLNFVTVNPAKAAADKAAADKAAADKAAADKAAADKAATRPNKIIFCLKGGTIKKVISKKLLCPKGYKKVKF